MALFFQPLCCVQVENFPSALNSTPLPIAEIRANTARRERKTKGERDLKRSCRYEKEIKLYCCEAWSVQSCELKRGQCRDPRAPLWIHCEGHFGTSNSLCPLVSMVLHVTANHRWRLSEHPLSWLLQKWAIMVAGWSMQILLCFDSKYVLKVESLK